MKLKRIDHGDDTWYDVLYLFPTLILDRRDKDYGMWFNFWHWSWYLEFKG